MVTPYRHRNKKNQKIHPSDPFQRSKSCGQLDAMYLLPWLENVLAVRCLAIERFFLLLD